MYERAYKGGDYIRIEETEGTVIEIGALSSHAAIRLPAGSWGLRGPLPAQRMPRSSGRASTTASLVALQYSRRIQRVRCADHDATLPARSRGTASGSERAMV